MSKQLDIENLLSFAVQLPDEDTWRDLVMRIEQSGLEPEEVTYDHASGVLVRDPDGVGIELLVESGTA